jgi:fructosamine-3-kinase
MSQVSQDYIQWETIAQHLEAVTGLTLGTPTARAVNGGCINEGYQLQFDHASYFVKLNGATQVEMFQAEAAGLAALLETRTIRVPRPLCWGSTGHRAYLVLEWLTLGGNRLQGWQEMGRQLARLHRVSDSHHGFGWEGSNTIGSTPQRNDWEKDWLTFWREHRLGYQLKLAQRRGGHFPQSQALLEALPRLLGDHHPKPSLVHGDLWNGNAAITQQGEPVIFDPAPYYGDREVDIAMTELFGPFPAAFYKGYNLEWELDPGYHRRKDLYNLYHILNHFNLFGGSYEGSAHRMIQGLIAG